jgi:hypothetical protein
VEDIPDDHPALSGGGTQPGGDQQPIDPIRNFGDRVGRNDRGKRSTRAAPSPVRGCTVRRTATRRLSPGRKRHPEAASSLRRNRAGSRSTPPESSVTELDGGHLADGIPGQEVLLAGRAVERRHLDGAERPPEMRQRQPDLVAISGIMLLVQCDHHLAA